MEAFPPLEQVEKVLAHCEGEMSSYQLLGHLLTGNTVLWIHETGWTVTARWGQWIDIVCLFDSKRGNGEEIMDFFVEKAREWNLKGIRTLSLRPGVARRAIEWGFRKRLVEYVREC